MRYYMNKYQKCLILFLLLLLSPFDSFAEKITILYSHNNNGLLDASPCPGNPCGGLARRASLIKEYRLKNKDILVLESGDIFSSHEDTFGRKYLLEAIEYINYDAICVGDQELLNDVSFFNEMKAKLPLISASLINKSNLELLAPPYLIKTVGSLRIGIMGIISPKTFLFFPKQKLQNTEVLATNKSLNIYLNELIKKVDLVILLSHQGFNLDKELALNYPEINIIIGAHSQTLLAQPEKVNNTLILQAGEGGKHLGVLELNIKKGKINSFNHKLTLLNNQIEEDAQILKIIHNYYQDLKTHDPLSYQLIQERKKRNMERQKKLEEEKKRRENLAYAFKLPDLEGNIVNLKDYEGKKYVVISFFATWCKLCLEEIPYLEKTQINLGRQLKIFLINLDDGYTNQQIKEFALKHNINLPILMDSEKEVAKRYEVKFLPSLFIIDKEGVIIKKVYGYQENVEKIISETILSNK